MRIFSKPSACESCWNSTKLRLAKQRRRASSDEIQQKLAAKLGVEQPDEDRGYERFNISPTQEILAVVEDQKARRMELLRWGLVPRWAKDLKVGYRLIKPGPRRSMSGV